MQSDISTKVQVFRLVDDTHPAFTELLGDLVVGDGLADQSINPLEEQLQSELDDAHWCSEATDLAVTRPVGRQLRGIGVTDASWRPKIGGIEGVEEFRAKLQFHGLGQIEVLVEGKVEIPLAR